MNKFDIISDYKDEDQLTIDQLVLSRYYNPPQFIRTHSREKLFQNLLLQTLSGSCFQVSLLNESDGFVFYASDIYQSSPIFGIECKTEVTGILSKTNIMKMICQQLADALILFKGDTASVLESLKGSIIASPKFIGMLSFSLKVRTPLAKISRKITQRHKILNPEGTLSSSQLWKDSSFRKEVTEIFDQYELFNKIKYFDPVTCNFEKICQTLVFNDGNLY